MKRKKKCSKAHKLLLKVIRLLKILKQEIIKSMKSLKLNKNKLKKNNL